ncbi:hypothetical protein KBJ98_05925 [Flavobacterium sp. F-328]|jgi:hypothetical protein|uniref:Uncharacterized protein n=1 Tax=Flavobacterium erciyesense TaxID=2825842 RepID=A0ABS5D2L0_9FLAO|nr:hypothetical protein [Flavobacterium erciyesense]MBQ0908236.1 hypothetical protein [Flavobacterium erciyesense]
MKRIINDVYRQNYYRGLAIGLDPYLEFNDAMKNEAVIAGFIAGRMEYERLNGCISKGIPERIVTDKILEDFLIAGLLGLPIDDEGYTAHQLGLIAEWYQSGVEKYEPHVNVLLNDLLEVNGIEMH